MNDWQSTDLSALDRLLHYYRWGELPEDTIARCFGWRQ